MGENNVWEYAYYGLAVFGKNNIGETGRSQLIVGTRNDGGTASNAGIIGDSNTFAGGSNNSFIQGTTSTVTGARSVILGGGSTAIVGDNSSSIGGGVVNGDNSTSIGGSSVTGNRSVSLGSALILANNAFGHGQAVLVNRDDQRTWGSSNGLGQKSRLVKGIVTLDSVPVNIVTLDLEASRGYGIKALVIAKNFNTDGETASFIIPHAMAYRDAAGGAVLQNDPIALSGINSGGGSTAWSSRLFASGNDILLEVTGDTDDAVRWTADFEFTEARSN